MKDRASDTPADTIACPNDSDPGGLTGARHDVMTMLQRAAGVAQANPPPAAVVHKVPSALPDAEGQPRPLEADISGGGPVAGCA